MDSRGSWETGFTDSGTRETVTRDLEGGICETGTQEIRGDPGLGSHAGTSECETQGTRTRDVRPWRGRLRRRDSCTFLKQGPSRESTLRSISFWSIITAAKLLIWNTTIRDMTYIFFQTLLLNKYVF